MQKKVAYFLLVFMLIFGVLVGPVSATEDSEQINKTISWEVVGTTLIISGSGPIEITVDESLFAEEG